MSALVLVACFSAASGQDSGRRNSQPPSPKVKVFLSHFGGSDQNWNSQNYLFNLHIIVSLVHIKQAVSHLFEVANALVHPCKWSCTFLCCFLHHHLHISCWSKCIIMGLCWIVSRPTTFRHWFITQVLTCKMVEQVVIMSSIVLYISIRLFFSKSVLNW